MTGREYTRIERICKGTSLFSLGTDRNHSGYRPRYVRRPSGYRTRRLKDYRGIAHTYDAILQTFIANLVNTTMFNASRLRYFGVNLFPERQSRRRAVAAERKRIMSLFCPHALAGQIDVGVSPTPPFSDDFPFILAGLLWIASGIDHAINGVSPTADSGYRPRLVRGIAHTSHR